MNKVIDLADGDKLLLAEVPIDATNFLIREFVPYGEIHTDAAIIEHSIGSISLPDIYAKGFSFEQLELKGIFIDNDKKKFVVIQVKLK